MIVYYKRIMAFLGQDKKRVRWGIFLAFFESLFANVPIIMILYSFGELAKGTLIKTDIFLVLGVMLFSILIRMLLSWFIDNLMFLATHDVCERERLGIGDLFRYFPMGFFTRGNLGRAAAIISIDLGFIEEMAIRNLDIMVNAATMTLIGGIMLSVADIRIGAITIVAPAVSIFLAQRIENVSREEAALRQDQQGKLTAAILEYAMGLSVIKTFNITGKRARTAKKAIQDAKEGCIRFEKRYIRPGFIFKGAFHVATALMVWTSLVFYNDGTLHNEFALVFVVFAFYVFLPAMNLGNYIATFSLGEAGLNRYEKLKNQPVMGGGGRNIKTDNNEIEFHKVSFAYDEKAVLKNISFIARPGAMTALVGQSGSGKTTIANLIVRFWDVKEGAVTIGGTDIREMTTDCLLKNISMVFQRVYLFHDTIKNNIRFGKPDATDEEITAAARAARCHDFISALPHGYDTMVTEAGTSLSGGEKQRISIARAILKNAAIVLLDEATASIDPDNEKYIQEAIRELVKNKTLIVIAHRLSTIQHADQIIVVDKGEIVESGRHDDLLEKQGMYHRLWTKRMTARSWKMKKKIIH